MFLHVAILVNSLQSGRGFLVTLEKIRLLMSGCVQTAIYVKNLRLHVDVMNVDTGTE